MPTGLGGGRATYATMPACKSIQILGLLNDIDAQQFLSRTHDSFRMIGRSRGSALGAEPAVLFFLSLGATDIRPGLL